MRVATPKAVFRLHLINGSKVPQLSRPARPVRMAGCRRTRGPRVRPSVKGHVMNEPAISERFAAQGRSESMDAGKATGSDRS